MTKTWIAVVAALLALPGTLLHAAPPEFKNLPPTEISFTAAEEPKALPPADAKLTPTAPSVTFIPGPCAAPCNPCPVQACPPVSCKPKAACGSSCGLNLNLGLGHADGACARKLWGWLTYRACHRTPLSCCHFAPPLVPNYQYFLYPRCVEGCGGTCGAKCNTCAAGGKCGGCK